MSPFPVKRSVADKALRESGLLELADIERAEKLAEDRHIGVDRATVALGLLSEDQVTFLIANRQGLDLVFPTAEGVDAEFLARFPTELLRRRRAVPLLVEDEHAVIAFADIPTDDVLAEFGRHAGHPIRPVLAAARRLDHTLEQVLRAARSAQPREDESVEVSGMSLFERTVATAFASGADELRFEPGVAGLRIRVRRNGALVEDATHSSDAIAVVSMAARLLAKLPPSVTPQAADLVVQIGSRAVPLRVTIAPTASGELVVLSRRGVAEVELDRCGLSMEFLDWMRSRFCAPSGSADVASGFVLVAATDADLLRRFVEAVIGEVDPANAVVLVTREARLAGEGRVVVGPADDDAAAVRAARAAKPDILYVQLGESTLAMREALRAAQDGARVLVGIVDPRPGDAAMELLDAAPLAIRAKRSLAAVVLLDQTRSLCPRCAAPDPHEDSAEGARVPVGCGECDGRGFDGHEVVAAAVRAGADLRSCVVGDLPTLPQMPNARIPTRLRELVAAGRVARADARTRLPSTGLDGRAVS